MTKIVGDVNGLGDRIELDGLGLVGTHGHTASEHGIFAGKTWPGVAQCGGALLSYVRVHVCGVYRCEEKKENEELYTLRHLLFL